MKKQYFILNLLVLILAQKVKAQVPTAENLVGIHVVNTSQMNGISGVIQGSLIYNSDSNALFQYDGLQWKPVGLSILDTIKSSTTFDLERSNNLTDKDIVLQDTQQNVLFRASINLLFEALIGQISGFELSTAPSSWLALNGQTIANGVNLYPGLAARYPSWVNGNNIELPNYNEIGVSNGGRFIRGLGDRNPGDARDDATAMPSNQFVTQNAGNHSHTGSTSTDGNHNHTVVNGTSSVTVSTFFASTSVLRSTGTTNTSTSGNHNHSLSIDNAGNHNHNITGGDAETRPIEVSLLWCVFVGL